MSTGNRFALHFLVWLIITFFFGWIGDLQYKVSVELNELYILGVICALIMAWVTTQDK